MGTSYTSDAARRSERGRKMGKSEKLIAPVERPYVLVRMPDKVFDSASGMSDRVAWFILNEHPGMQMVEVQEHGGWWLRYIRKEESPKGVVLLQTANDQAVLSDMQRRYIRESSFVYRGDVDFPAGMVFACLNCNSQYTCTAFTGVFQALYSSRPCQCPDFLIDMSGNKLVYVWSAKVGGSGVVLSGEIERQPEKCSLVHYSIFQIEAVSGTFGYTRVYGVCQGTEPLSASLLYECMIHNTQGAVDEFGVVQVEKLECSCHFWKSEDGKMLDKDSSSSSVLLCDELVDRLLEHPGVLACLATVTWNTRKFDKKGGQWKVS